MDQNLGVLLGELPERLQERSRVIGGHETDIRNAEFVLYWMRTACRLQENPALQVAIECANRLELPVLIYHALSERYPYASDRHHTFILEGARDVQAACVDTKLTYALHLERRGHRGPHLKSLADRASLVVTEDMPVQPLQSWTPLLARTVSTPVLAVDTACVVPMKLVGRAYERAFAFRNATKKLLEKRISLAPQQVKPNVAGRSIDLPFEPVDLSTSDIASLVSECKIDHSIAPVPHTVGGSVAGYSRWNAFKETGLAEYARRRNNALIDGVSRMSPYLHYGMVSPMRIARETNELDNDGANKYLDELFVWRELAYAFCFHRPDHGRLSALPDWALETLQEHERDERRQLLSWEALARGKTGDAIWDAAQRSLLMHGELHNNVRMTWGKSILNWTPDAKSALATIIDLNHRYALDGRDPASYGGILWCLGQFDRPFPPERPILGTVRDRSTEQHAKRLDARAYLEKTTVPLNDPMPTVAIVGAGISGLMCARTLADHGFSVTVFEKSRGVGGRMSTRRTPEDLRFDHGAQYFTARDERFQRYVKSWIHDGLVASWGGSIVVLSDGQVTGRKRGTDRFVAVPGMNAVCKHLAEGLDIRLQTQVESLDRDAGRWRLSSLEGVELGKYDLAIVSAPAAQTAKLLQTVPSLAIPSGQTEMNGCWALMLAFSTPLDLDFDGAFVHNSAVAWVAKNQSKPGREIGAETWVVHATAEWSESHIEEDASTARELLLSEFWKAIGTTPTEPEHIQAHRWRFAIPSTPLADTCLFDAELQVGACGDWCGGPRVEGAFLSGVSAAGRVMGLLKNDQPAMSPNLEQRPLF